MIATMATAFLLTILVCIDSHTWIYLTKRWVKLSAVSKISNLMLFSTWRRPYQDKAETAPLFPASTSMSPTAPITSGTSTINRTLLHSQQMTARNGNSRGLANQSLNSGDSPPPTYDVVVHDISLQRHGFFLSFLSVLLLHSLNLKRF